MLLSFIIPLYNCERYIVDCLNSIFKEKVPEALFEVLVINDGSHDNGEPLCKQYSERFHNIKVVTQSNAGASTARNHGLQLAKGDYVWFVDADDQIIPAFFPKAISLLQEKEPDLLCFNHRRNYGDHQQEMREFAEDKEMSGLAYLERSGSLFLWNKIYRRAAIGDNRFLDGTKNIEDWLFNLSVLIDLGCIHVMNDFGYDYNCTNGLSTSRNKSVRNLIKLDQDSMTVHLALWRRLDNYQSPKRDVLREHLDFSVAGHLYSLVRYYNRKRLKKRIDEYHSKGLYPIRKTGNRKANLFLKVANSRSLVLSLMRLRLK